MARRHRNRKVDSGMSGLQLFVLLIGIIFGLFLLLRANPELASRLPPEVQRVIDSIELPNEIQIPTGTQTMPSLRYNHYAWHTGENIWLSSRT